MKSLSELIFSRETLVGHHLALCGRGETRAPRGTPASDPPSAQGTGQGAPPHLTGRPPTHTPAAPPPTPCKPVYLPSPLQAGPIPAPAPQSPEASAAASQAGRGPGRAPAASRRRRRPRGLTLRPAEFSLSGLQAAKFARRFFPAVFLHTTGPKKSCTEISLYRWL